MSISPPVPMKKCVPHFNEPLSLPPELSWNLKTDRGSRAFILDKMRENAIKDIKFLSSQANFS